MTKEPKSISIKLSKSSPSCDEITKASERLGIPKNQLLLHGIKLMCCMDKDIYNMLNIFSSKTNIELETVINNFIISRLAIMEARHDTLGKEILPEFVFDTNGNISGKELYDKLYVWAKERLTRDKSHH